MVAGKARRARRAERALARKARARELSTSDSSSASAVNIEQLIETARAAESQGDYEKAIGLFESILERRTDDVELHEELASIYLQATRPEEAERVFKRAIEIRPEVGFEKYVTLAQLLGNCSEALEMARKGIDVLRVEAMGAEGERLQELQGFEASAHCAVAEICLGLIEESNDPEVAKRMDKEVEKAVMQALALSEEGGEGEIEAILALGNLRLSQGKREQAVNAMKQVLIGMAGGLEILERGEGGDEAVVQALEMLPTMEVRIAVGKQLVEVELWRAAISVLGSVMWECDFNVEVWYLIAVANWMLGEKDEAIAALENARAVLRNPEGYEGELEEEMIDKLCGKLNEDDCRQTQECMQE